MSGCKVQNPIARPVCRAINAPENAVNHQQMVLSLRASLARDPGSLKAFNGMIRSKAYGKLAPDRQIETLKMAKTLGCHKAAFEATARIVDSRSFGRLTDDNVKLISKTMAANRNRLKDTSIAYRVILDDNPFEYASDSMKKKLMSRPHYYKVRTNIWLNPHPEARLPTREGLEARIKQHRDGLWSKYERNNTTENCLDKELVKNKRDGWNHFAPDWYRDAGDGKTYGEHYSDLVGGCRWWDKLYHAHQKLQKYQSCLFFLPPGARKYCTPPAGLVK